MWLSVVGVAFALFIPTTALALSVSHDFDPGPPAEVTTTIDSDLGLTSIVLLDSANVTVLFPAFPGTLDPVQVVSTLIDQSLIGHVELRITETGTSEVVVSDIAFDFNANGILSPPSVPEPSVLALLAGGVGALALGAWRR
jgi:hypothetical protein